MRSTLGRIGCYHDESWRDVKADEPASPDRGQRLLWRRCGAGAAFHSRISLFRLGGAAHALAYAGAAGRGGGQYGLDDRTDRDGRTRLWERIPHHRRGWRMVDDRACGGVLSWAAAGRRPLLHGPGDSGARRMGESHRQLGCVCAAADVACGDAGGAAQRGPGVRIHRGGMRLRDLGLAAQVRLSYSEKSDEACRVSSSTLIEVIGALPISNVATAPLASSASERSANMVAVSAESPSR